MYLVRVQGTMYLVQGTMYIVQVQCTMYMGTKLPVCMYSVPCTMYRSAKVANFSLATTSYKYIQVCMYIVALLCTLYIVGVARMRAERASKKCDSRHLGFWNILYCLSARSRRNSYQLPALRSNRDFFVKAIQSQTIVY